MKTTGESSIPKFLVLVFLGHPNVGENFHDHDTVGYEIEHGYSLVGKCSAREYMMYYVHCTVVIKCILKQVRFPTVPFNGMARLRWGR